MLTGKSINLEFLKTFLFKLIVNSIKIFFLTGGNPVLSSILLFFAAIHLYQNITGPRKYLNSLQAIAIPEKNNITFEQITNYHAINYR